MRARSARGVKRDGRRAAIVRTFVRVFICMSITGASLAQPARIADLVEHGRDGAPGARHGFRVTPMPGVYGTSELQQLWRKGRSLELEERFLEAARLHEGLVSAMPEDAYAYWKISRNLWRHAETLPVDAKAERMALFERSEEWASRGLSIDPECAPCMLWKFGAMGRIATTRGVMKSLTMGREMKQLLDRGIALSPDFADTPSNSTLGNLYYASAVFHRVVPEWRWLEWLAGVRGDVGHSLEMIRHAVDLAPERIDYLVEYGAVLQCYADRRDAPWAQAQAAQALERATRIEPRIGTDVIDQQHARTLMADPSKSCGYSRDGWIDTARRDVARAR
jgi:tetratricopeptide (TPR) repeat protein